MPFSDYYKSRKKSLIWQMCNVTLTYDLKVGTTDFNPFWHIYLMYRCNHHIWLRLEFLFDTSEKESFQKLKIGINVTLLEIVIRLFQELLISERKMKCPVNFVPHIEFLTVLVDSISFYFSTAFQYLKSLWTHHKKMRKDNFTFIIYLKMSSKGWISTGKNW